MRGSLKASAPLYCCGKLYRLCSECATIYCTRMNSDQVIVEARSLFSKNSCLSSTTLEPNLQCVQGHRLVGRCMNYLINKVLYDDCHALRLFSNALISVVSVISHSVYTLVLSVVVLSNS